MDKRYTLKIDKIIEETSDIKTFTFKYTLGATVHNAHRFRGRGKTVLDI